MNKISVIIELNKNEQLELHVEGIQVGKVMNVVNGHKASIHNIGIIYVNNSNNNKKEDKILQDVSVDILIKEGLKLIECDISTIKMTLD